jgi:hypothetical protein
MEFSLTDGALEGTFVDARVPAWGGPPIEDVRVDGVLIFAVVNLTRWEAQAADVEGARFYLTGSSGNIWLRDMPTGPMQFDLLEGAIVSFEVGERTVLTEGPHGSLRLLADGATGLLWERCEGADLVRSGNVITLGPAPAACSAFFRVHAGTDVLEARLLEDVLARGALACELSIFGWMGNDGSASVSYGSATTSWERSRDGKRLVLDGPGFWGGSAQVEGRTWFSRLIQVEVEVPDGAAGQTVVLYMENVSILSERHAFLDGQQMERLAHPENAFVDHEGDWPTGGHAVVRQGNVTAVVFRLPGAGTFEVSAIVAATNPDWPEGIRVEWDAEAPPAAPAWWVWPLLGFAGLLVLRRVKGHVGPRLRLSARLRRKSK